MRQVLPGAGQDNNGCTIAERERRIARDGLSPVVSGRGRVTQLLLAQARHEGFVLLTADRRLAAYGSPVRLVREA